MEAASVAKNENQVSRVKAHAQVDRVVLDLVGGLATYSPMSHLVLVEGGGSEKIDILLIQKLFPLFCENFNVISAGNKTSVKDIHKILNEASEQSSLNAVFFSVVDRDYDEGNNETDERQLAWDRYHIENYLLEPKYIVDVIKSLEIKKVNLSEDEVSDAMRSCAQETVDNLVKIKMMKYANSEKKIFSVSSDKYGDIINSIYRSTIDISSEIIRLTDDKISLESLKEFEPKTKYNLLNSLKDDNWRSEFRGGNILSRLTKKIDIGIRYKKLRNMTINKMVENSFQPDGMKRIIDSI